MRIGGQPPWQVATVVQYGGVFRQVGLNDVYVEGWLIGDDLPCCHQDRRRYVAFARRGDALVVEYAATQAGATQVIVETLYRHRLQIFFC